MLRLRGGGLLRSVCEFDVFWALCEGASVKWTAVETFSTSLHDFVK